MHSRSLLKGYGIDQTSVPELFSIFLLISYKFNNQRFWLVNLYQMIPYEYFPEGCLF